MRYLVIMLLQIGFFMAQGQESNVDKLIKQGSALYDNGMYNDAINKYQQAIALDKKNSEAHYELAYTYLKIKNWDEALYYSRIVMSFKDDYWLDALLIYGTVMDKKGNSNQSIREYKKALKKYPDGYLLYYNLALSYAKIKEYDSSIEASIKCLQINESFVQGHILLSSLMKQKGEVLKSMLPLYYCHILEDDDENKQELTDRLQEIWMIAKVQKPVQKDPISKYVTVSGLNVAEAKIINISKEVSAQNPDEPLLLVNQTVALFDLLNEVQTGELDFFDIKYVDFFTELYRAGHAESFGYFICNPKYKPEVLVWVSHNQAVFNDFINWMELK